MKARIVWSSVAAAAFAVTGAAVPAYAAVTEDGVYNCAAFPAVQFRIQGGGVVLGPGDNTAIRYTNSPSTWRSGDNRGPGGFWSVTGRTTVDLDYTRGVCRNFG